MENLESVLKGLRLVYAQNEKILSLLENLSLAKVGILSGMLEDMQNKKVNQQKDIEDLAKSFGGELV